MDSKPKLNLLKDTTLFIVVSTGFLSLIFGGNFLIDYLKNELKLSDDLFLVSMVVIGVLLLVTGGVLYFVLYDIRRSFLRLGLASVFSFYWFGEGLLYKTERVTRFGEGYFYFLGGVFIVGLLCGIFALMNFKDSFEQIKKVFFSEDESEV